MGASGQPPRDLRTPRTHGALAEELGDRLALLAGFRNALVHVYWKLDLDMACQVLHTGAEPLREFCAAVKQILTEADG